jgi:8-oxo-dGTP diphosphatase
MVIGRPLAARSATITHMQKTFIDKLAYIYIKDGKLLITLSHGKDTWYIPGGKRETGESDQQALAREVKEELDVDIVAATIKHYGTFEAQAHGKPEGTVVRMTCYTANFTGELKATTEIEKIDFFDYAQKGLSSPVDHLIFDDLHDKGFLQ